MLAGLPPGPYSEVLSDGSRRRLSTIIPAVAVSPDLGISREYAIDPAPTHDEKHRTHPTTRAVRQDLEPQTGRNDSD
jgi:hypothetical protein